MKVTVNPIQTINVRTNQGSQQTTIKAPVQFIGADVSLQLQQIESTLNVAFNQANTALATANTKLSANGGIIYGSLEVTGNAAIDGTFTAVIDGGTFI